MKTPDQPLSRKISFSLGISEKDEYEGGELMTKMNTNENSYKLDKGELFLFPSWMLHKVTPVTKGKRRVICLLYTSPSPRDATLSRMPSSA